MTMTRDYYNRRVGSGGGPPTLTLAEIAAQVALMYEACDQQAYFQQAFGYHCVDSGSPVLGLVGSDLRMAFLLATSIRVDRPTAEAIREADEISLFTWIEFIHDHVAKPDEKCGYYHDWNSCGWHYNPRADRFDVDVARKEWRGKVNSLLRYYEGGFQLSEHGDVIRIAPDGMIGLVGASVGLAVPETDRAKVANAVHMFHLGRATREQRTQAVRALVDVLEFHREVVRSETSKKDEADLFQIANTFAIRHHRADQKYDYDDGYLTWIFYVYLATVHLVLGRVAGHEPFSPPRSSTPAGPSDDDLPF